MAEIHKHFLAARDKSDPFRCALFFVHYVQAGGYNWFVVSNGFALHAQRTEEEFEGGAIFLPAASDGRRRTLVQVKDETIKPYKAFPSIIANGLDSLKSCRWEHPAWNTDNKAIAFLHGLPAGAAKCFIAHDPQTNTYSTQLNSTLFHDHNPDCMAFDPAYISIALKWMAAAGAMPDACGLVLTPYPNRTHQIVIASGGGEGDKCARLAVIMGMLPNQEWQRKDESVTYLSYPPEPTKEKEESLVSTTVEPDGSLSS